MLFHKIKQFHTKTMEAYRREEEEKLPEWKKKVLRLHERSNFLFYYEEYQEDAMKEGVLIIKGDHVKGLMKEKSILYLYDGEGKRLGDGVILSNPEEQESQRKGLFTHRRNEFEMKLLHWRGNKIRETDRRTYLRYLNEMQMSLSLITDMNME